MADLFAYKPNDLDENTKSFSDLLPTGKIWNAATIDGSVFNSLLKGISVELGRYQATVFDVASNTIPNFTTSYIDQWEQEVGIPDSVFDNTGSDETRRRNILIKLGYMNLQTNFDYQTLANLLNLSITISNAGFTTTIDVTAPNAPSFTYTFPFTFGSDDEALFKRIVLKQKPAYQEVLFT